MKWTIWQKELKLAHAFTLSRGSAVLKNNLFVELEYNGLRGYGEAAPNIRYGETPQSAYAALENLTRSLSGNPLEFHSFLSQLDQIQDGEYAAKSAIDMAVMDLAAKTLKTPLYRIWGLSPKVQPTSMTIAIDEPEAMAQRALEAKAFQFLKIKLGTQNDRQIISAIRRVSNQTIRVDANEAWLDKEHAIREIEWLHQQNVDLVEQPMPAANFKDMVWLKARSPLPLIADEAFTRAGDLPLLAEACHGVNLKLTKTGGTLSARESVSCARMLGLKIMIGCMIESGLGIAAAAHLAPMADFVDLDGNLLLSVDPYPGHPVKEGVLTLKDEDGLGVDIATLA